MSAEQKPDDEGDETASIDLAIGFFCSVLMLFVFIDFNFEDAPRKDVVATLGQETETVEVLPGAWSAVNQRGSFAVWTPSGLTLLDLGSIAGGVVAPTAQYQGDNGYHLFTVLKQPAPNAFQLTLDFVVADIPGPWQRETIAWGDQACFTASRPLLTVFLPRDEPDLALLLALGQRCGLRLRLDQMGEISPEGRTEIALSLSESAYSAERMFR